jgi:excisionase family DNA binding protein
MEMYNATVDVAKREQLTDDQVDAAMARLEQYHPALGGSPRGWQSAIISLPAASLMQATSTALALVEAAFGAPALAVEVMTTAEFDARQGWSPMPDLVSVSEAAELLGVSRQRVLQRIEAKTLPATRVGRDWVIARSAVEVASE